MTAIFEFPLPSETLSQYEAAENRVSARPNDQAVMLVPRELYRAHGFSAHNIIGDDPLQGLTPTESAHVRMCGNSACPPVASALVLAKLGGMVIWRAA